MPRGREHPTGPASVPGWVVRSNDVIDRLLLLIQVSLTWWALTIIGLLVLGVIPATCAAADVIAADAEDRRPPVFSTMWATFRAEIVRGNIRALPFAVVQLSALLALVLALSGRGGGPWLLLIGSLTSAVALGWTTAALAVLVATPRVRRQDLAVAWRIALLGPGALPVPSLALVLVVALWSLLCLVLPPVSILLGAGLATLLARSLLGRRMEDLLARHAPVDPSDVGGGE